MTIADALLVVVDVETTGLDYAAGDRIVEFAGAYMDGIDELQMLVNPGRPIPVTASAIHHLVDADVVDAKPLEEAYAIIADFVRPDAIVCAHNAVFDRSMLPWLAERRGICTKRLAQHLFPSAPAFNNQVLRYYFGGRHLNLRGEVPHRASADVIVTSFVLQNLVAEYRHAGHPDDVDALISLSESPIYVQAMSFGKHRGSSTADVPESYMRWAIAQHDLDADLRFTFAEVLAGRGRRLEAIA